MSTRNYRVDGINTDLAIKPACRVATTANITLSGLQTIDGIALAADDRVLVKNQTDTTQNGVYEAKANTWVRSSDFNGPRDVTTGTLVYVNSGSTNEATFWRVVSTDNPIVVGVSEITIETISVTGPQGPQGPQGDPGADGTVDLTSLANETTIDLANDELLMRDADEGANNAITVQVLYNAINSLSAETSVDSADSVPLYDSSGSATDKATVANLLKAVTTLSDTTITASDEILFCDVDDSNNVKKDTIQGILDLVSATGGFIDFQVFDSSGTWTKPANTQSALIICVGGGGGGYGNSSNGSAGGTSSFGSFCQATGGGGGTATAPGTPGTGSGGDLNLYGGVGSDFAGGNGGAGYFGGSTVRASTNGPYGSGGFGANTGYPGSAGGCVIEHITSGLSATETVTIGALGARGGGGDTKEASAGKGGVVLVYSYA